MDTCEDFTLESRSHIDFASVSKDANGVAAIKIASSDGKTILFGNADESLESQVISFPTEERVIGNFGSSNAAGIVDLGFITKNVECTAEDVAEDEAEAAENAENTDDEGEETDEGVVDGEGEDGSGAVDDTNTEESFGSIKDVSFKSKDEEGDDDGSDVVMWVVVIVIIAIVLAVIIIIVVHCCSKNKSTSISKVGDVGAEMKTGPATANNSSSIPQESEEDGKARANKESDRQYFGNTEDV